MVHILIFMARCPPYVWCEIRHRPTAVWLQASWEHYHRNGEGKHDTGVVANVSKLICLHCRFNAHQFPAGPFSPYK